MERIEILKNEMEEMLRGFKDFQDMQVKFIEELSNIDNEEEFEEVFEVQGEMFKDKIREIMNDVVFETNNIYERMLSEVWNKRKQKRGAYNA